MSFLRAQLDDDDMTPSGRCDNCGGLALPQEIAPGALAQATSVIHRPGAPIEPRRMWPTGLAAVGLKLTGRIAADESAEPGRALGALSDLGWGSRLREVFAAVDGPLPDDVFTGLVAVLASWEWAARPVAVITIASRTRPLLVASLGDRLAAVGKLPLLGQVERARAGEPVAPTSHNSAQRVRAVHGSFDVSDELALRLRGLAGPLLLVDDLVDSGWTMTIATGLLRRAGAPGVLPLALATT